jgi:hypothetical protein
MAGCRPPGSTCRETNPGNIVLTQGPVGSASDEPAAATPYAKMRGKQLDEVARRALNQILAESIEHRIEYGGMICKSGSIYVALEPRTQHDPTSVDVGQRETNAGCPPDTTPVAIYHTHPTYSVAGMKADYNAFSENDIDIPTGLGLAAIYAGTLDGSFLKYDTKTGETHRLQGKLKNESGVLPKPIVVETKGPGMRGRPKPKILTIAPLR